MQQIISMVEKKFLILSTDTERRNKESVPFAVLKTPTG